ncbi:collagen alpha-1(I) chain-like [Camelus dromedarius]|uniref:collagen alpha-1(I) chain-like n=1 Tax=Camelus dromedarius TaxID=9838 RepID=UPI00311A505A
MPESRSLSELTRQIAPPTKNGHAPPPTESRKSYQSVNPVRVRAGFATILPPEPKDFGFPEAARRVMGITPPHRQSASFMVGTTTARPAVARTRGARDASGGAGAGARGGGGGRSRPRGPPRAPSPRRGGPTATGPGTGDADGAPRPARRGEGARGPAAGPLGGPGRRDRATGRSRRSRPTRARARADGGSGPRPGPPGGGAAAAAAGPRRPAGARLALGRARRSGARRRGTTGPRPHATTPAGGRACGGGRHGEGPRRAREAKRAGARPGGRADGADGGKDGQREDTNDERGSGPRPARPRTGNAAWKPVSGRGGPWSHRQGPAPETQTRVGRRGATRGLTATGPPAQGRPRGTQGAPTGPLLGTLTGAQRPPSPDTAGPQDGPPTARLSRRTGRHCPAPPRRAPKQTFAPCRITPPPPRRVRRRFTRGRLQGRDSTHNAVRPRSGPRTGGVGGGKARRGRPSVLAGQGRAGGGDEEGPLARKSDGRQGSWVWSGTNPGKGKSRDTTGPPGKPPQDPTTPTRGGGPATPRTPAGLSQPSAVPPTPRPRPPPGLARSRLTPPFQRVAPSTRSLVRLRLVCPSTTTTQLRLARPQASRPGETLPSEAARPVAHAPPPVAASRDRNRWGGSSRRGDWWGWPKSGWTAFPLPRRHAPGRPSPRTRARALARPRARRRARPGGTLPRLGGGRRGPQQAKNSTRPHRGASAAHTPKRRGPAHTPRQSLPVESDCTLWMEERRLGGPVPPRLPSQIAREGFLTEGASPPTQRAPFRPTEARRRVRQRSAGQEGSAVGVSSGPRSERSRSGPGRARACHLARRRTQDRVGTGQTPAPHRHITRPHHDRSHARARTPLRGTHPACARPRQSPPPRYRVRTDVQEAAPAPPRVGSGHASLTVSTPPPRLKRGARETRPPQGLPERTRWGREAMPPLGLGHLRDNLERSRGTAEDQGETRSHPDEGGTWRGGGAALPRRGGGPLARQDAEQARRRECLPRRKTPAPPTPQGTGDRGRAGVRTPASPPPPTGGRGEARGPQAEREEKPRSP